jgi:cytochrome d ubiquinol oxidase subunit II
MQGVMVGGLIQGVSIRGDRFAGGVSEVFRPFALLTACAVLLGYSVLGAGWLHLKAQARLRRFAERALRVTAVAFVAAAAAVCIGAVVAQPGVGVVWRERLWPLTSICGLFIAMALALFRSIGGRRDGSPFIFGQGLFALGIAGFGLAIFPNIVPFRLTLWSAASSPLTLVFLLIGAAVVTPIVLTYSAFAYFVFRGKTPASGWEP